VSISPADKEATFSPTVSYPSSPQKLFILQPDCFNDDDDDDDDGGDDTNNF
jgi:hypothetical protein